MKKITLFLLLALPFFAHAQNQSSFETYFGANFTDYTNKLSNTIKGRLSYDFGMAMALPMNNDRREWLVGLRIMTYGDKHDSGILKWGTQHNGNGGFDPNSPNPEGIKSIESKRSYIYFEVPVSIRQQLYSGKTRLFLQASTGPSFYLTNHVNLDTNLENGTVLSSTRTEASDGFRKVNAFAGLGLGLEIPVGQKLDIQLLPHAQMQLLSTAKESVTEAKWYAVGIRAGVRYQFL